jgi:hypothetical protein
MKSLSGVALACALLATVAGIVGSTRAHADAYELLASNSSAQNGGQDNNAPLSPGAQSHSSEPESQPRTAVVLRFAVESQSVTDRSALAAQACPEISAPAAAPITATPSKSVTVDPKILDKISGEIQTKLSKKMSVMVNPDPTAIPVGALVISGCITKANGGNAASRLIGMNAGASHLAVHVVALTRTKDGWSPMDTFDIQVKGGDVLPPIGPMGLAVHAARDTQQTLSADAKKLADHILKKLSQDMKSREQAAENSGPVYERVGQMNAGQRERSEHLFATS